MWEEELAEVARRRAALDWGAAVAEARAQVVRWRAVDGAVADFYKPLPLVAKGGRRGDWLAEGAEPHRHPDAVGLDAHDRPVLAVRDRGADWEAPRTIWRYDDGGFDEIDQRTFLRATVEDARVVRTADAESHATHAGVVTWDGDRAVRYDRVEPWRDRDVWRADIWDLEADAEGRPTRLRYAMDNATPTGFDAALAHAHALAPTTLLWDGRVALPEPWPDDPDAMVEPLAQALDAALRAAVGAAPVDAPFCLRVRNGGGTSSPPFPPVGIVASAAFRDRMRGASGHDGQALEAMRLGEGDGVATLELTELLDADALRACRVLSTALASSDWPRNRAAARIADALGDRLSALLNAAPPPGAAEPFAALVDVGDPYGDERDSLARCARCSPPRVWRTTPSGWPATRPGTRCSSSPRSPAPRRARASAAPVSSRPARRGRWAPTASRCRSWLRLTSPSSTRGARCRCSRPPARCSSTPTSKATTPTATSPTSRRAACSSPTSSPA
jgi:hypothetical protein